MKKLFFLLILGLSVGFWACDDDDNPFEDLQDSVIDNYATLVFDSYTKAYNDAVTLKTALDAFAQAPSETSLAAAKTAWLQSRESYGVTEAYRFGEGPIDVIGSEEGPEGLLNSWPLDESFIDYVDGNAGAGIINDLAGFPTLTKAVLEGENGNGGEENVSIGYHAIEFLLWGQDLTDPSANQAGSRPYTDFVDGGTATNQDRRRAYLTLCGDLLLDHLQLLLDEWDTTGSYRKTFTELPNNDALSRMMTGIAFLAKSELAGERMLVAHANRDQEDEHSCFSDNTHRDIRLNFDGIRNVYLGLNNGVAQSAAIDDLIEDRDPALAQEVRDALEAAKTAVENTGIPFDIAISDDALRPAVLTAVNALQDLGDKIAEAGNVIGVQVDAG